MKRAILMACVGLVSTVLLPAQNPGDPNEGSRVQWDAANGIWRLKWWGKAGRTYFIQHSDNLAEPWQWVPVIESGHGSVREWGFTTSGDRFFLRLRHTDAPTTDLENGDFDGDGLGNMEELLLGTDPLKADTDGDGIPDGWEVEHGLNPFESADAALDGDGDGLDNLGEHHLGTDPAADDSEDFDGLAGEDDLLAPASINVETVAPGQNHVTWVNQDGRATKLLFLRTDDGSKWTTLAVVPASQSEFTDMGANPALAYFYSLIAVE